MHAETENDKGAGQMKTVCEWGAMVVRVYATPSFNISNKNFFNIFFLQISATVGSYI